ncbi:MAG: OmpA family protein [Pseudomonadota bacterium]
MHPLTFGPRRAAACALALLAFAAGAAGAAEPLSKADLINALKLDPDADFAGNRNNKALNVRQPDRNGACLPEGRKATEARALGIIALAPQGAPQASLPLQFEFNSYRLSDSDRRQLDTLAAAMNDAQLREARFTLSGHTDSVGTELINNAMSCARALAARTYLQERGVNPARMSAYGFGSSRPVGSVAAQNRRVEIRRAED